MVSINLDGKNAVVTGGARGLGKAIVEELAMAGANVWVADVLEEVEETARETAKNFGVRTNYSITDVSAIEQVKKLFADATEFFGRVDIVVNTAGIVVTGSLLDATQDQVERITNINLVGSFNVLRTAFESMIPNRTGKIVAISSISGRRGFRLQGHYGATKAGVINFAQSIAVEAAPYGINCNTICPGIIRTPMWDKILDDAVAGRNVDREEEWKSFMDTIPQGRAQTPQEIAQAVLFLCSDLASAVTGQALNVDGGATLN